MWLNFQPSALSMLPSCAPLEAMAADLKPAPFLFGDAPGLAEIALVPQVANAARFETDLSAFPRLVELDAVCRSLEAFQKAAPEIQTKL